MKKRIVFCFAILTTALGTLLKGDETNIFKENDILNIKIDPKFKKITESNIALITILGSRCISVNGKNYIISTYGIKYDPIKNGEKLNAEKIAILKAKAQIVAFVHGSKIINVTSYDVDVTAKTDKGTIKAQGSIEVNESFKETIEGTLKGAFTVAKWTNRLEDTVYVALGVEVP